MLRQLLFKCLFGIILLIFFLPMVIFAENVNEYGPSIEMLPGGASAKDKRIEEIEGTQKLISKTENKANHTEDVSGVKPVIINTDRIDEAINRDDELLERLANKSDVQHNHDDVYYTKEYVDNLVLRVIQLENAVKHFSALLRGLSKNGNDLIFSGINVHIVNGTGSTEGTANGYGNLIVGYNESRDKGDVRKGSHNIVIGSKHDYLSCGGLVTGAHNTISGKYASIIGGNKNMASGAYSTVTGGENNNASSRNSSIMGGNSNRTSGDYASINGGANNKAKGKYSSINGGKNRTISGTNPHFSSQ